MSYEVDAGRLGDKIWWQRGRPQCVLNLPHWKLDLLVFLLISLVKL